MDKKVSFKTPQVGTSSADNIMSSSSSSKFASPLNKAEQPAPPPTITEPPLPEGCRPSYLQAWHEFDAATQVWKPIWDLPDPDEYFSLQSAAPATREEPSPSLSTGSSDKQPSPLVLMTWNVDAFAPRPEKRMQALLHHIWHGGCGGDSTKDNRTGGPASATDAAASTTPAPVDIIFLQEVCVESARWILADDQVRRGWFSSEGDDEVWREQGYATLTLAAKHRFGHRNVDAAAEGGKDLLGPVWRTTFKTRYERDGLCCDLFLRSSFAKRKNDDDDNNNSSNSEGAAETVETAAHHQRVRLINVHLDSLPARPSFRPDQLAASAALLRTAGVVGGLVAGDFNPVQAEDETLLSRPEIDLVDAWLALRGGDEDEGHTWGTDEYPKQRFPAARLDKIAVVGLRPLEIEVVKAGRMEKDGDGEEDEEDEEDEEEDDENEYVPAGMMGNHDFWSDHHGLRFCFEVES